MKNQNEIKHYRIKETQEGFTVQRKKISVIETGYLWWKKKIQEESWNSLVKDGYVALPFLNIQEEIYKTLEEAKQAIEGFEKYPIYHYLATKREFPKDKIG